ncbi:MAG: L-aspartate oxidase [Peptococcaceae bacterium]|nr:L-aspartate oxidase [Peptococcaceae bacterium]
MRLLKTDFLIIGSGIAGLAAALGLASVGKVTILTKKKADDCNSVLAQGGIAAAVGKTDSSQWHSEDTLRAGAGLSKRRPVRLLTDAAPQVIRSLSALGVRFDRDEAGELDLAMEGAHGQPRVLHHGDQTGAEIWRALHEEAERRSQIEIRAGIEVLELLVDRGRCVGVVAAEAQELVCCTGKAVILATGGCGNLFERTTNLPVSTGDGMALAWRAGAVLADMEFIQFHPTALAVGGQPHFLISEAVRGEGAALVNDQGERFMSGYHELADLASRDVVSRAIAAEQEKGRSVFLDATGIGAKFAARFPGIHEQLRLFAIDPVHDWIPVTPVAHFVMGGVKTDSFGRSSLARLWACGEAACTGVHGANRLASNSLLEGLVFGGRIGEGIKALPEHSWSDPDPDTLLSRVSRKRSFLPPKSLAAQDERAQRLREIMWRQVGIIRDAKNMIEALSELEKLGAATASDEYTLKNMLQVAGIITRAALARRESRGGHYRSDHPRAKASLATHHDQRSPAVGLGQSL